MASPTLHAGDSGAAVKIMQQGLHKALPVKATNLLNGAYGSRTIDDVEVFKRAMKIYPDGTIFGSTAWAALKPYLTLKQRIAVRLVPDPKLSTGDARRKRIVAEAMWLYANRWKFTYAQVRPYPRPPNLRDLRYSRRWDCSSTVTACYHAGGAPDPNGSAYNGSGYTGTLVRYGAWTSALKLGDLCFYGSSRSLPSHVAIYVGNGQVVSFGHTPPNKYPVRYRGDYLGARTYPVA